VLDPQEPTGQDEQPVVLQHDSARRREEVEQQQSGRDGQKVRPLNGYRLMSDSWARDGAHRVRRYVLHGQWNARVAREGVFIVV